jgi:hypothetical protein
MLLTGRKRKKLAYLAAPVRPLTLRGLLLRHKYCFIIVRKYVEGMENSAQLLDLLAAESSDAIEPTRALAGRQALYPEVCISRAFIPSKQSDCFDSTFQPLRLSLESKLGNYIKGILMRINTTT